MAEATQTDLYGNTEDRDLEADKLDALPIRALVATSRGTTHAFHAPTGDQVALCGRQIDGRTRRVETMPAASSPCRDCFTERVAEKYGPREADIHGAVRDE